MTQTVRVRRQAEYEDVWEYRRRIAQAARRAGIAGAHSARPEHGTGKYTVLAAARDAESAAEILATVYVEAV